MVRLTTDDLIERYGRRYAFEWFVRAQDERHLKISKNYTDQQCKKITAIAATNAVITILLLIVTIWKNLRSQ